MSQVQETSTLRSSTTVNESEEFNEIGSDDPYDSSFGDEKRVATEISITSTMNSTDNEPEYGEINTETFIELETETTSMTSKSNIPTENPIIYHTTGQNVVNDAENSSGTLHMQAKETMVLEMTSLPPKVISIQDLPSLKEDAILLDGLSNLKELQNTRASLINIITPQKENAVEKYEFEEELEAVAKLNKTIHDLEILLTNLNEIETAHANDTSINSEENTPSLHNDAISHKNPLDTQNLENKVELIELHTASDKKTEMVREEIGKPLEKISDTTSMPSMSANGEINDSEVTSITNLNAIEIEATTETGIEQSSGLSLASAREDEIQHDDENDGTQQFDVVNHEDDIEIEEKSKSSPKHPLVVNTISIGSTYLEKGNKLIEAEQNITRNAIFEETTTESMIENDTTDTPLRIEAVVAELEEVGQSITEQHIFDDTTTQTPLVEPVNADPLPIFIPNNTEEEVIFETEAVIAEEKPSFELDDEKIFIQTTTLPPNKITTLTSDIEEEESEGGSKFEIEAVVAEDENRNEDGTFLETTTVSLRKIASNGLNANGLNIKESTTSSEIVDIKQSSRVNGPLDLETIDNNKSVVDGVQRNGELKQEKLARKEDSDVEDDDDQLLLQKLSEIPPPIVVSTKEEEDKEDDPASLLTKFIDGFFVPKQKHKPQKKKKNPNKAFTSIRVIAEDDSGEDLDEDKKEDAVEKPEKDTSFPVSEILSGIYKLVSNYVTSKPNKDSDNIEKSTTTPVPIGPHLPQLGLINVHNMPRDQLIVEFLDDQNSPSDPFVQMNAPNLREELPPGFDVPDSNIPAFPVKPNPPRAITLSPFNSPALKVQEPPKLDDTVIAGPLPLNAPIERLSPEGFVRDVEKPSEIDDSAPPLPFLPGNFLRGGQPSKPIPLNNRPSQKGDNLQDGPSQSAFLALRNSNQRTRDPINIPLLPDLINESREEDRSGSVFRRFSDIQQTDPVESLRSKDARLLR